MEKIQPGKFVELGYNLYAVDTDGTEKLVHQSDPSDPERIIFGVTRGVIRPLEEAIDGLEKGSKFNVSAKADEAFGQYDPEQIVELPRDIFEVDGKFDSEHVRVGAIVPMMSADGMHLPGKVLEVTPEIVKMDFNHPLAGKDVRFDGEILLVRDATPEELSPVHGCGCGCHSCGDDCGCDHEADCGDDSCCCGDHHHDNGSCGCH